MGVTWSDSDVSGSYLYQMEAQNNRNIQSFTVLNPRDYKGVNWILNVSIGDEGLELTDEHDI